MNGKPLTMRTAWSAYDRLFEDDGVAFVNETGAMEPLFRRRTSTGMASPKLWADAWFLAVAGHTGGPLVTFDLALARRSNNAVLLLP